MDESAGDAMSRFDFARRMAMLAAEADDLDKAMLMPRELRQLEQCRDEISG